MTLVSPGRAPILAELARTLGYPKVRRPVPIAEADAVIVWLERSATLAADPTGAPPVRSLDPTVDCLSANRGAFVSAESVSPALYPQSLSLDAEQLIESLGHHRLRHHRPASR